MTNLGLGAGTHQFFVQTDLGLESPSDMSDFSAHRCRCKFSHSSVAKIQQPPAPPQHRPKLRL